MGIRRRCVRIGVFAFERRDATPGCGKVPQVCDGTATTRTTTARTAYFFRKNANKTSEATSPKGFTSTACVPQKSRDFRKNTSRIESKGLVRGAYVEFPRLRKIPESLSSVGARRQAFRVPIPESSIQILMGFRVISEARIHHHHKCAHTGMRAAELPEKPNKILAPNSLCRVDERSKNQIARSKNTRICVQSPSREMGYVKFQKRSKNAKIACSPKKGFRRKFMV
jgi:hypothetical protein